MYQSDLLNGKRVLVTGGGSGLGKAMGRRFLELGAALAICGRREPVLAETAGQVCLLSCATRITTSVRKWPSNFVGHAAI